MSVVHPATGDLGRPSEHDRFDGRRLTLLLTSTLTIMAGATISPSLPGIEAEFRSWDHVQLLSRLVLTLPALFVAICAPMIGPLSDRMGRRNLLIGSIVLYGLSGVSGLVLDSLSALLIGRAFLGLAVGGVMTLGTALAADYFPGAARDRYMGMQQACTGVGGLLFLAAGGWLAEVHWRAPFVLYGLAFLLLPAVVLYVRDACVAHETSSQAAATPKAPSISCLPVAALCLAAVLNSAVFYLIPSQLPFYMRTLGLPAPSQSGIAVGLVPFFMALSSLCYGRVRASIGISSLLACGFALMAAGLWCIGEAASLTAIAASASVVGVGMGLVMPSMMSGAMMVAAPEVRGRIAGWLTAGIFVGQFISPLISQPWIARSGYAQSFSDGGLLLAFAAIVSWMCGRSWFRIRVRETATLIPSSFEPAPRLRESRRSRVAAPPPE